MSTTKNIIFLTVISNCRNVINVYICEKLVKLHAFNTCKKNSGIWYYSQLVMDRVSKIGFLWPEINVRNGLNASWVELGFSSFSANFFPFLIEFSKCHTLHIEKSSQIASIWQKMKKSLIQLAFNPFLTLISGHKNPTLETQTITRFTTYNRLAGCYSAA